MYFMNSFYFPDFRLRSFLEVFRSGTVLLAAEHLGLTQPAISQHLKALEQEYGTAFFALEGRKLVPTRAGQELFRHAQEIESNYERTWRRIKDQSRQKIKLGLTRTIAEFYVPNRILKMPEFFADNPPHFLVENTKELTQALLKGTIDGALIEGPYPPERLRAQAFASDELCAARSPHFLLQGKELQALELLEYPLIIREKGSGTREIFENWLKNQGLTYLDACPPMEIGGIGPIRELCKKGLGIAILSKRSIQAELKNKELLEIKVQGMPIPRNFVLIMPREGEVSLFNKILSWLESSET